MSDLLERYVQAVGRYLGADGNDDTLAELRANLLAEMDDKAEGLGRALTEEEEAQVLRGHGHPSVVAARYRPQRSLIGPEIFPYYWLTLRRALPFVVGIFVVSRAMELIYGPAQTQVVVTSVVKLLGVLFYFFGWMTLTFAVVELIRTRYPRKVTFHADWDPRKLAKVEPEGQRDLPKNPVADLVALAIFSVVWLLFPRYGGSILLGPGSGYLRGLSITLAPVWFEFYWTVAALNLVQVVLKAIALKRSAAPWRRAMKVGVEILGVIPAILLLQVRQYFVIVGDASDSFHLWFASVLNLGIHHCAELAVVLMACKIAWDVGQLVMDSTRGKELMPVNR